MSSAKLTLISMTQWLEANGIGLFDDIVIPEGLDKEILLNNILVQGGEFEVTYPDPYFLKIQTDFFFKLHALTFQRWFNAINKDYEPLYNYDRYESWRDTKEGGHETDTSFDNKTESESTTENDVSETTTNTRSAFDADAYQPHDRSEISADNDTDFSESASAEGTGKEKNKYNDEGTHSGHIYGNIGVTTSSKMLSEYLSIQEWNIYDHIAVMFLQEMTVPVYI